MTKFAIVLQRSHSDFQYDYLPQTFAGPFGTIEEARKYLKNDMDISENHHIELSDYDPNDDFRMYYVAGEYKGEFKIQEVA